MAYNASYASEDVSEASIDGVTIGLITAVAFLPVIVLVILGTWLVKKFRGK